MITAALSLLGLVGGPGLLIGIAAKLGLGFASSALIAPVAKLCVALVDALIFVARWLLEKLVHGLDHIVKSVPAVVTLIVAMWATYAYTLHVEAPKRYREPARIERPAPAPKRPVAPKPAQQSTSWLDDIFGQIARGF